MRGASNGSRYTSNRSSRNSLGIAAKRRVVECSRSQRGLSEHLHSDAIELDTGRLEAFSDGVLAIIITIMILEIRPPDAPTLEALRPLLPVFAAYILSFIFIGIYWN